MRISPIISFNNKPTFRSSTEYVDDGIMGFSDSSSEAVRNKMRYKHENELEKIRKLNAIIPETGLELKKFIDQIWPDEIIQRRKEDRKKYEDARNGLIEMPEWDLEYYAHYLGADENGAL